MEGSIWGLVNPIGIVDSSYVIESAGMCVITCVFGKGPVYGE